MACPAPRAPSTAAPAAGGRGRGGRGQYMLRGTDRMRVTGLCSVHMPCLPLLCRRPLACSPAYVPAGASRAWTTTAYGSTAAWACSTCAGSSPSCFPPPPYASTVNSGPGACTSKAGERQACMAVRLDRGGSVYRADINTAATCKCCGMLLSLLPPSQPHCGAHPLPAAAQSAPLRRPPTSLAVQLRLWASGWCAPTWRCRGPGPKRLSTQRRVGHSRAGWDGRPQGSTWAEGGWAERRHAAVGHACLQQCAAFDVTRAGVAGHLS